MKSKYTNTAKERQQILWEDKMFNFNTPPDYIGDKLFSWSAGSEHFKKKINFTKKVKRVG